LLGGFNHLAAALVSLRAIKRRWRSLRFTSAILADGAAAIPTIVYAWSQPKDERPVPWILFSIGYGVAVFAITDHTFANYILPLYMFLGTFIISVPLVRYHLRHKIPLKEWT
jgi:hypothetical protein